jgi:hypothetical protein
MVLEPSTDSCSGGDPPLTVNSRMEIAKRKDSVEREWSHVVKRATLVLLNKRGPTMTINFVLLRSPLLAPRDRDTVIVSREPDLYGARLR